MGTPLKTREVILDQLRADLYHQPGVHHKPPRRLQQGDQFLLQSGSVEHEFKRWFKVVDAKGIEKGYIGDSTKLKSAGGASESDDSFGKIKDELLKGKLGGIVLIAIAAILFILAIVSGYFAVYLTLSIIFLALGIGVIVMNTMKNSSL